MMPWGIVASIAAPVVGGLIGADAQQNAADTAAASARDSINLQREQYNTTRGDNMPFRNIGLNGLQAAAQYAGNVPTYTNIKANPLNPAQAYQRGAAFKAPTMAALESDPGYQFGRNEGINAIQNGAAAKGGLYSGAASKALAKFATDYATTKYNDAYNRDLTAYQTNFNTGLAENQNAFNQGLATNQNNFNQNLSANNANFANSSAAQTNKVNQLLALAGYGQTANAANANAGQNFANNATNISTSLANAQGAAGVGQANTYSNALSNLVAVGNKNDWWSPKANNTNTTVAPGANSNGFYNLDYNPTGYK